MIKKFAYIFFGLTPEFVLANEPKDWQLGFQKAASKGMEDIVWFHDYMLLPIITAITVFVLFLLVGFCVASVGLFQVCCRVVCVGVSLCVFFLVSVLRFLVPIVFVCNFQ